MNQEELSPLNSVVRDLKAANASAQVVIDAIAADPDGLTLWTPVYEEMLDQAVALAAGIDLIR